MHHSANDNDDDGDNDDHDHDANDDDDRSILQWWYMLKNPVVLFGAGLDETSPRQRTAGELACYNDF